MALRPARTIRRLERPYTRVSQKNPRKSYVVGVPFPKIHQFRMGNPNGDFDVALYLVSKDGVQIRHNALEAARISSHGFLEKKIGSQNYYMQILKYPFHVIREKPIATGAGADRYSQGMRLSFGKPVGTSLQVKPGMKLVMVKTKKEFLDVAKEALRRFKLKIPARCSIEIAE
ncbi:MAG: 50S ribosomal protein L16 [Candidatus Aenigmarchaeota archaeon]|nr:50S ribosomal protein L16 [Candidatus Aenigmarchaeota archaeon]MCX8191072.1 50S ribosomal protein L16 [Candidatus Aenigmarchaeota archaeon]MDW8160383.1 50S ribosomal protein L16 [Candidatus Aenigmarchaeota archaeon]